MFNFFFTIIIKINIIEMNIIKGSGKVNKKGFTLAELLISILILAVLAIFIIPNISDYIKISKDDYNSSVKRQMLLSGKNYYSENTNLLPKDSGGKVYDWVSAQKLASLKYTSKEFIDSEDRSCMPDSFVVAYNNGIGVKYYACMKCGDKTYMSTTEKEICEAVLNYEEDDNKNNKNPSCTITKENTSYTDDGLKITINATDEDGYISSIKLFSNKHPNGQELIKDTEKNQKKYTKTINLTEYGNYTIMVYDNSGRSIKCGQDINYSKPTTTTLKATMYYITSSQYNTYKDKNLTQEDKKELQKVKYDGSWKNGYIYVNLHYYNNQILSLKAISEDKTIDLKNKKYFFLTQEGNKNYTIQGNDINNERKIIKLNTKLDRTNPTVTLTNSSGGNWTNKDVTVKVNASDKGGSGIAFQKYGKSKSDMTNTVAENSTVIWKKANQTFTMYVEVTDGAGNKSNIATTNIKQDITAPVKKSGGSVSVGKTTAVKYSDNLSGVQTIRYRFSSSSTKPTASSSGWGTKTTGSTTVNVTYYVYSKGCDYAGNCSINYLGSYRKTPAYPINNCKIRGNRIVKPGYRWKCTYGHWHTTAYTHYCTDKNGKLYTKKTNPSLVTFSWVCPTRPYGKAQGWTVIND